MRRGVLAATVLGLLLVGSGGLARDRKPAEPPARMPALKPAVIDDTLVIGGEEIAARKLRSRMTVEVGVNGTGPYRFVVDSGADTSVIGSRLASALNLAPGRPVLLNGITESRTVDRVMVDSLQLGSGIFRDLELPRLDERDLGATGMIGLDALVEQRLMLDFDKRRISVDDARKPAPRLDGEIVVTARLKRGQLILTQVKANGLPLEAVIDTGSEITIGNMALRNAIARRRLREFQKIEVIGVTGKALTLEMAVVNELRIGGVIVNNIPIAFADIPPFAVFGMQDRPSLLLGTDLMENFRKVSLDFRARKVRFQLRSCDRQGILIATVRTTSRIAAEKENRVVCGH
ncbi:retroviral-like aspartic protease family protein [Novosphingobium sp.]|uniref:retroviral-like aspartic protease family protein n=1 Tax=Novosphingobium sp. TaxID=1874826 RepID=UPI0022BAF7C7|nr:retroviral-like aspartic protease family protein [Novosphingobium sp.]MCZ8018309.1 retroviral-like aspartic protease family protein [Novosphingobium sp.]MCZ8033303.1 retroviral-like aspartic protease family protein [Novosphingobium sp.]MCZ8051758.1 retroviral-like aspartic protease family protein [Novosphingobium sp.]MCZ8060300.1 retroviral-like aspartic protease family protein [Novosphingobium sp.]MCZ8231942.1 retroviral-like aspartic protease family protein [Novosphingobium sp.]